MLNHETAKLIEFAPRGHTIHWSGYSRTDGYARPDTFCQPYHWWADPPEKLTWHIELSQIPNGGVPILDLCPALDRRTNAVSLIWRAPLLNVDLTKPTGLKGWIDYGSIAEYIEYWIGHGARVGQLYRPERLEALKIEW